MRFRSASPDKKKSLYKVILCIIVVYATDTVPVFFSSISRSIALTIITLVFGVVFLVPQRGKIRINNIETVYFVFPIALIILSQCFNLDPSMGYENKIIMILFSLLMVKTLSFEEFRDLFVDIMVVIAAVSLLVWITAFLNIPLYQKFPISYNKDFYSMIITNVPVASGNRYRNFGPFWEPGAFQAYLNIAIIFILNSDRIKTSKIKIILLVVANISTFSTTGYLCFGIIIVQYLVSRNNMSNLKIGMIVIFSIVVIGTLTIGGDYLINVVFGKFSSLQSSSLIIRMYDIKYYFEEWLKNPFTGVGITRAFSDASARHMNSVLYRAFDGTTTTLFRELASFGIFFTIIKVSLLWKFSKKIGNGMLSIILVFFVVLITLNTEDFIYSLFFTNVFYYGLELDNKTESAC